mmetsp:Transcript_135/g.464  ORF Transcript_135/g.464 Transcript_135/m.464 type:complete len:191 (+) Transcript_135:65-637(+)|eukprot:CAMPEP_0175402434 /NCGR_PEP_ID=MMETSP0095-20121207/37518_1 /TAXON_ID=311494 /ORGANISM="Alexandrium monilatum, Strain CCMP3105" /LENGTH=190 /DNA_ID=CAMNT_0016701207 /DNA_START=70 /DNA_END=642 /DNA_ORIENTATION=+
MHGSRRHTPLTAALPLGLAAVCAWCWDWAWVPAAGRPRASSALRGRTALLAGDSGEFDFGEYEAPTGVAVAEAEEEEGPQLAPPEAERFLQKETGVYECSNCGFEYNQMWGYGKYGPGTQFKDLPNNWRCPECKVSKDQFRPLMEEIAGFAENQEFGLGFNTWTGSQKGLLIWGGLGIGFFALLSGYLLE